MNEPTFNCPNCKTEIRLTDLFTAPLTVAEHLIEARTEKRLDSICENSERETEYALRLKIAEQEETIATLSRAIEELKRQVNEQRYRTFVEHATDSFFLHGSDGIILDINTRACESLGYHPDELVGMEVSAIDPDMTQDRLNDLLEQLASGKTICFESRHRRKNGTLFPVEIRVGPFTIDGRMFAVSIANDITERLRIRAVMQTHSNLLNSMAEAVNVTDSHGMILVTNPALDAMFGYKAGELIGTQVSILNDATPEENERIAAEILETLNTQQRWEGVVRNRKKDGTVFFTQSRITPVEIAGTRCWVAVQEDITTRRRVEHEILAANKRFQRVINTFFGFYGVFSPDFVMLDVNENAIKAAGMSKEELIGKKVFDPCWFSFSEEVQQDVRNAITRAAAGETVRYTSLAHVHNKGLIHIDIVFGPMYGTNGLVEEIIGFAVDVTERIQIEKCLRESEHRLRQAQSIAHIGSWEHNLNANFLWWSDEVFRLFEIDPTIFGDSYEPFLFNAFLQTVHPDDRDQVVATYNQSVKDRVPFQTTHRLLLPDGRIKFVEERGETEFANNGAPLISRGTVQDVTERTLLDEKLRRSLDEKETLLREVHHRVKNNLQIISSLLYIHARKTTEPSVGMVFDEARTRLRAMTLVHEKLYRSSDIARVNLSEYVHSLVEELAGTSSNVQLKVETMPLSLPITVALPCGMILTELITNVFKHACPDNRFGEATIRCSVDGGRVTLSVSDNGVGFPTNFDSQSMDTLGWQLIHNLTSQLDGTVTVENHPGTRVTISFLYKSNKSSPEIS